MRDWLKEKRIERGLTQKQVAEKLGISESYYAFIENGTRQKTMDISLATQFATLFGMQISDIVDFERREVS